MNLQQLTEPLCRWCHETLADHRGEDAPMARMPCGGRKSGFVPVAEAKSPLGAPLIFGKPMIARSLDPTRSFELAIGPLRLGVMPAIGSNKGKSYWFIERKLSYELASGYSDDHAAAARDIERALIEIETTIRQARGA